jgi:hypothetical protein
MDLRKEGMCIETDRKTDPANCHYGLIATAPAEKIFAV